MGRCRRHAEFALRRSRGRFTRPGRCSGRWASWSRVTVSTATGSSSSGRSTATTVATVQKTHRRCASCGRRLRPSCDGTAVRVTVRDGSRRSGTWSYRKVLQFRREYPGVFRDAAINGLFRGFHAFDESAVPLHNVVRLKCLVGAEKEAQSTRLHRLMRQCMYNCADHKEESSFFPEKR
jgi:hypothetical protein